MSDIHVKGHELVWAMDPAQRTRARELRPIALADIVSVLALLSIRDKLDGPAYGPLAVDMGDLADSPINLVSFRARCAGWQDKTLTEVVDEVLQWCLQTHLRVALRKLRHTGQATFRIRPTELGIEFAGDVPDPAKTTPRVAQAMMILRDIGAIARERDDPDEFLGPTELGNLLRTLANE
jgi:hypothetical protein